MKGLLPLMLAGFLFLPAAAKADRIHRIRQSIQTHREQVEQVEGKMEEGRARIETMRQKESGLLDRLDKLELQLEQLRGKMERLRSERASLRREIAKRRQRLEELTGEIEKLRGLLCRRLKALYKFGNQAYLEIMASAQDIGELQRRWLYVRTVAEQDSKLLRLLRSRKAEEEKIARELQSREERLNGLVAEIGLQKKEMERVKRRQVDLLRNIHSQREIYQRYVEELAAVSRKLQAKIEDLRESLHQSRSRAPQSTGGGFAGEKGALPYPVQGKVVSDFGVETHEEFGIAMRRNGIEIATRELSPVVAIYSGQVLYSGWIKGYGKVIIIDHGDKYYTLTAHLREISRQAGQRVEAGEVIGYAGYASGDSRESTVYFEIRHRSGPLDPQSWLLPPFADRTGSG